MKNKTIPIQPLSILEIAQKIAADRNGTCNYVTVWRAIARLKLEPFLTCCTYRFFSPEQAGRIAASLRTPNRKAAAPVTAGA